MDPVANLAQQLDLATQIIQMIDDAGDAGLTAEELSELAELTEQLAELVMSYHTWRLKGGFAAA